MTEPHTAVTRPIPIAKGDIVFRRLNDLMGIFEGHDENGVYPLGSMAAGIMRYDDPCCLGEFNMVNDEVLYVLDGQLEFVCGGRSEIVESGGFIYVPKGIRVELTAHKPSRIFWVGHSSADVSAMLGTMKG
ncbi:cupin domain-containing protein [Nocardia sp. CA-107356]|uniref:cupin domain-containing protein n=1 Tax=Nocardia sp. CA-107356 TaxID=3239972 RepID=UPI003D90633A